MANFPGALLSRLFSHWTIADDMVSLMRHTNSSMGSGAVCRRGIHGTLWTRRPSEVITLNYEGLRLLDKLRWLTQGQLIERPLLWG